MLIERTFQTERKGIYRNLARNKNLNIEFLIFDTLNLIFLQQIRF